MPTILIAEDDRLIREMLSELLEYHRYVVLDAKNGGIAREALMQRHVDLVITDNEMPVLSGFELVRFMRNDPGHRQTPVIMMSGKHSVEQDALAIGVNVFLSKPFNNRELVQIVDRLLQEQPGL